MALTREQFENHLKESGLLSERELRAFWDGLPADQHPQDAEGLARRLVADGILTRYQAAMLWEGKTKGLVLGNYIILEKLGEGGMGKVFKARHRRMDRIIALKMLPPSATKSEVALHRFHQEVKAVARLSHPNIVTAHDADEAKGVHFLVMEYVEGADLADIVRRQGPLSVRRAVDYVFQAARGLAYAHAQGVVHRDVKPANLLVNPTGTQPSGLVKILDMGLARLRNQPARMDVAGGETTADHGELTQSGKILGTVDFIAPEQATDTRLADHRADVYSLGCTLYFLLTGRAVFEGHSVVEKLLAHRDGRVPSLRAERADVSETLDRTFQRMLAKDPGQRFQNMEEVMAALEAVLAKAPEPPPPARPETQPPVSVEEATRELARRLLGVLAVDTFFLAPEVPPDLLAKAQQSFVRLRPGEEVLALCDDTLDRSGELGFALTTHRVHFRNQWAPPLVERYALLVGPFLNTGSFDERIELGASHYLSCCFQEKKVTQQVLDFLREASALHRRAENPPKT